MRQIIFTCVQCKTDFESKKADKNRVPKYCGQKCYGLSLAKWKTCRGCGKQYYNWLNDTYCSMKCVGEYRRGKPLSIQHRKALSEAKKGRVFPHLYTPEAREKLRIALTGRKYPERYGPNHHGWKGGRAKQGAGYIMKLVVHGKNEPRKFEHRVVMEEYLGRPLRWDSKPVRFGGVKEVVHHINHDKADNRIENLEVMLLQDHSRAHISKEI